MTAQKIFNNDVRADLTDILFEHRNKAYGAYTLRKHYDERVNKSLLITMGGFLLFFLLVILFTSHPLQSIKQSGIHTTPIHFNTNIDLKSPPAATTPKTKASKPTSDIHNIKLVKQLPPPIVKPDSNKTPEPKTDGPLTLVPTDPGLIPAAPSLPSGTDGTSAAAPTKPVHIADVMPQFPGGYDALQKYLKKNVQFTPLAIKMNAEGKVFISFVVDVGGSIQDVKILKDKMGYGCAQNAVDVIKNMPSWTPGSNNGHLVPVEMMQPIDFEQ